MISERTSTMTRKQKKMLVRIAASAVLLIAAVLVPYQGLWRFALFLPAYFVIGWDVLWRAVRNIAHGQVFDENFLMALATVGALLVSRASTPRPWQSCCFTRWASCSRATPWAESRQSIAELDGYPPGLRQCGAGRQAGPGGPGGGGRWGTSSSSRPGSGCPWTALVLEGAPLWTPPPSPASPCPGTWRPGDERDQRAAST